MSELRTFTPEEVIHRMYEKITDPTKIQMRQCLTHVPMHGFLLVRIVAVVEESDNFCDMIVLANNHNEIITLYKNRQHCDENMLHDRCNTPLELQHTLDLATMPLIGIDMEIVLKEGCL